MRLGKVGLAAAIGIAAEAIAVGFIVVLAQDDVGGFGWHLWRAREHKLGAQG
jgi:hypothetical protein